MTNSDLFWISSWLSFKIKVFSLFNNLLKTNLRNMVKMVYFAFSKTIIPKKYWSSYFLYNYFKFRLYVCNIEDDYNYIFQFYFSHPSLLFLASENSIFQFNCRWQKQTCYHSKLNFSIAHLGRYIESKMDKQTDKKKQI